MKINLIEIREKLRPVIFRLRREVFTAGNLMVGFLVLLLVFWAWGSVSAMNQNHALLQEVERKKREEKIARIQAQTLQFEQNYLKSAEYQEIAAREKLGLAMSGEHVLILPDYPEPEKSDAQGERKRSNFSDWMNFLFGGSAKKTEE